MKTISKVLALASVGIAGYVAYDRFTSGTWIWEKTTQNLRIQQAQLQQQITQIRSRETERQRKESQVMHGKYASQAGWITPKANNYGMSHY